MIEYRSYAPDEVPVPYLFRNGTARRIRYDAWPVMATLLHHMALTGCSLTREMIYSYIRLDSGIDPSDSNFARKLDAVERRCQRAIVSLEMLELIETFKVQLFRGKIMYILASLTSLGQAFCREYGWQPVESDWEILKKHHQGESQKKHSAAVLLFAMHARARGWQVVLLPKAAGDATLYASIYDPDLKISKCAIQAMVEVETKAASKKTEKWHLSNMSQRLAAVCALSPKRRQSLEMEILAANTRCFSTDFYYLNNDLKVHPFNPGELWANILHP